VPAASCKGEKPMHASFRSCARSFSKAVFGFLLICASFSSAQNTKAQVESNHDLPDAPMPVTTAPPKQSNWNFTRGTVLPSFEANRSQAGSWMGVPSGIEHPAFRTNSLAPKDRKIDIKAGGRSPANLFAFEPIGGHANRAATDGGIQWYTRHIPWAGPIMRRGLKISKAHPHLTTAIKTLKPRL
jgi:hypothetical protein